MSDSNFVDLVNRGIELAPAQMLEVDGYTYLDKDKTLTLFQPPIRKPLAVTTLSGLVKLLEAGIDAVPYTAILIHVKSHDSVSVLEIGQDEYGNRRSYINLSLVEQEKKFQFNTFYSQEEFNIGLSSLFVPETGSANLLAISGNLTKQNEVRQEDDGITQRVTAKAGVHLVADKVVVPRVTLQPYRTFREAIQPASDFIFRVKSSEERGNQCALFEADGGYWKIQAMENVATWLTNNLKVNEQLASIPVVY